MKIYRRLECGGFESKNSETLLDGWEEYPNKEIRICRLKELYPHDEVAEVIGYYDESMDEEELEYLSELEETDYEKFIEEVYKLGADNGNFEESILFSEHLAV